MSGHKQNFVSTQHLLVQETLRSLENFVIALNDEHIDYEAWLVFHVWLDARPRTDVPYYSAFRSWQMFHWKPEPGTLSLPITDKCQTIAEAYLQANRPALSKHQSEILTKALEHSPDIYEICSFDSDYTTLLGTLSRKKIRVYNSGLGREGRLGDFVMAHTIPLAADCFVILGKSHVLSRKAKAQVAALTDLAGRCKPLGSFEILQSDFFNLFHDLNRRIS